MCSMIDRRNFLKCIAVAAAPAITAGCAPVLTTRADSLRVDPKKILDLPEGFSYNVVSRAGDRMSDRLTVPFAHDGMAAFPGENGRVILVCNHELGIKLREFGPFGPYPLDLPRWIDKDRIYDFGGGRTPGAGGTTTTIYNPETGKTENQHLSLTGTELNCAGGPTPWGSWLSCEECFTSPGDERYKNALMKREQRHGYVFEVPASATGLVDPKPIKSMGRFEHEAVAIDEKTGIAYMTEDRHYGLIYRYIPDVPGKLIEGGRLQALAILDRPSQPTHNWSSVEDVRLQRPVQTAWIDLDNVDSDANDLRLRGAAAGAATFARGEGLCTTKDGVAFACTIGGPARLGQVFTYTTSPFEGTPGETESPGQLELIAESDVSSLLRHADNLIEAPWGDLIVCEDTANSCGIIGIRPDRTQYAIADNAHTESELAGACFSPDGKTLFVNIQYPGMTIAITGPWADLAG
jgi:secreted PhoX family phosphatase